MKRWIFMGAACWLLAAGAASASPVQDAAARWGLLGVWATDCSRPASPDNSHDTYALESDGSVSLTYDAGPSYEPNRYSWTDGGIIAPDEMKLDGVFMGDHLAQHTVLQKNEAGQLRVLSNIDGTGKVLVENGAFPDGGGPPWANKCS